MVRTCAVCSPLAPTALPAGPRKILTLVLVQGQAEGGARSLLLGLKKRGFGAGYMNGFGGKVEHGETILAAAERERHEEAGVAPASQLERRGVLTFVFDDGHAPWETHVFYASGVRGEPAETDEMRPMWVREEDLDYSKMWADDEFWYPYFLRGKCFQGTFWFENTHTMVDQQLEPVEGVGHVAGHCVHTPVDLRGPDGTLGKYSHYMVGLRQ
ncbi:unnamed protein product [Pedinophyceae sp. YPF-701]|nr:unnamed protein product [Pedinophyceae sp. YPF-701]